MIRTLRVTVDGHEYQVTVEDLTDTNNQLYPAPGSMTVPLPGPPPVGASPLPPAPPAAVPASAESGVATAGAVIAPMSGVLVEILVHQGQQVPDGATVAVIEAMKMKTPVVVKQGGTVQSVSASVGDGIQVGQTILILS
ncbi:biotin/lipoyl-containing protein [Ammonicoccus fulvus]|uniref:Biotin/lipoyl-containing protein n=1 Tax=Ammonicoccus fulvus TaxID=3138240 RepID=A0ABZ3FNW3_9ACTN